MQDVRPGLSPDHAAPVSIPVSITLPLRAVAIVLGLLLAIVLIGAYGFASTHADRVFPGVRAAGVEIGGLAPDAASGLISQRARTLAETRIQVRVGDRSWRPTLVELGLATDVDDLSRRAFSVGRSGSPLDRTLAVVGAVAGPHDVGGARVSRRLVEEWTAAAARQFDQPAVDARLEIMPDGQVRLTKESPGRRLDQPGAVDAIERALNGWTDGSAEPEGFSSVLLPQEPVLPSVTAADLSGARDQATRVLSRSLVVRADGDRWSLEPSLLASLVRLDGAGEQTRVALDAAALGRFVDRLAGLVARAPRDATLAIGPDGALQYAPDQAGRRLEREAAAQALRAAILLGAGEELALPTSALPAAIRAEHLAAAKAQAERALSGPFELVAGDRTLALDRKAIAELLRIEPAADGRTRQLRIDTAPLRGQMEELAAAVHRPPRHGRLRIEGGGKAPVGAVATLPGGGESARVTAIVEGQPGQQLDVDAALALVAQRLTGPERKLTLPVREIPALTSQDRGALGKLELLDWSTTSYAGGVPERGYNIELAAERLDGVIVPPGETFSFNRALGPTNLETGYKWSWGIIGGGSPNAPPRTVPSVGGGICQVATTMFHAVFWSGLPVEERHWHLYWIPKYGLPPKGLKGLDATVDYDSGTDLQWTNNTAHPVVIQARTDGSGISFGLYGTSPGWKVAAEGPVIDRYQPTSGATVEQPDPSKPVGYRLKVEEARDGFRAAIVRVVTTPDGQTRRATFVSDYVPSRHVWVVGTGRR
ncbi:MAG TPA: VanW family protein [Chloroflexota bacterium]